MNIEKANNQANQRLGVGIATKLFRIFLEASTLPGMQKSSFSVFSRLFN